MEALRGHPVLLAETFVDPAKFAGTCCRAADREEIGEARASTGTRATSGSTPTGRRF